MRKIPFLKVMALSTLSCACLLNASAAKQVFRTEKFGDGYAFSADQCVSTTDYVTGPDGRTIFTATVKHNGIGDQFTDRSVMSYAEDGLSSVTTSQTLRQYNFSSGDEEILEFVWANSGRSFNFYNTEGKLIRAYGQSWTTKNNVEDWNDKYGEGWEYEYNNNGLMTAARYWQAYDPETAPRYTFSLSYDDQNRLVEVYRDGNTAYSPLHLTLTWGENGNLERVDQKSCSGKDDEGNPIWYDNCYYLYEYENGMLVDWIKYSNQNNKYVPTIKNVFEYGGNGTFATYSTGINTQGITYGVATTDYDNVTSYSVSKISVNSDGSVSWTKPTIKSVSYLADLESANSLTPTALTAKEGEGVGEVLVSFNVPKTDKDVKVILYRDCETVFTRSLEQLGDAYDAATGNVTISDKTSVGDHNYSVALLVTDADGTEYRGHASTMATLTVTAKLPVPTNFRVTNVRQRETTSTGDDGEGHMVTQTIISNIVTVAWDPISKDDAETYGFNRYEVWDNFYKIAAANSTDYTRRTLEVNFEQYTEGDVWLEVDYGMGHVSTEKIHVNVADYLKTDKAEVWGIAKIYNPESYDTELSMVKGDLTDTDNEPQSLLNLYAYNDLMIYNVNGGTTVGEYYFANMSDDNGINALYSLNFTDNEVVRVGTYNYGDTGYESGNFAYDSRNGILYATSSTYDSKLDDYVNQLMTIDYANGGKATQVATLSANPYLMTGADGVIYAATMAGTYSNYTLTINTLDPATGELTPVPGIESFKISNNYDKAIAYHDGRLHITIGTSYYVVDLKSGSVTTKPSLKKGYCALTFSQSTLTAEAGPDNPGDNSESRKLYRTASYGDSMGMYPENETYETLEFYDIT